ncbi:tripartite tricarboxylate transporter substrate binding protein [Halomonas shantousis]
MSRVLLKGAVALALIAASSSVLADYPEKPITIIVPWTAGGGTDTTARTIASALEKELGQTVNVVNRTGGSGVVGHTAIVQAKPDGYTLGLATVEVNMMHWQGLTDLTYEDFTPIGQINFDYAGIHVADGSPFDSLETLVASVKEQPKGTYVASGTGLGGIWHIAYAGFMMDQGIAADKVTWIPSQGAAPAMTELAAGGVDIAASSVPEARSMIEAGKVRSLGVMAPERLDSFPDVPTIEEAVGSNYQNGAWRGIVGPQDMDPDIVAKLEQALEAAYRSDEYQSFMSKQGFGTEWRNSKDFGQFMAEMDTEFGKIMESVGLSR